MITPSQYTRLYETWHGHLEEEAIRIARSSDTRSWLMKNLGAVSDSEALRRAVECIADLTGDECLRKKVKE